MKTTDIVCSLTGPTESKKGQFYSACFWEGSTDECYLAIHFHLKQNLSQEGVHEVTQIEPVNEYFEDRLEQILCSFEDDGAYFIWPDGYEKYDIDREAFESLSRYADMINFFVTGLELNCLKQGIYSYQVMLGCYEC